MRYSYKFFFITTVALCGVFIINPTAKAALWSGIVDPSRAVDWSQAGATISITRTQCFTTQCNVVSNGTTVTAASINAALASAPANTYVLIPAGSFTMSAGLNFDNKSNITLRGAGSNGTFLTFTGSGNAGNCNGNDVCASSADTNYWGGPSNIATWSGTNGMNGSYSKGATSIILNSVNNLSVGMPVVLDQIDDQADNGGLYVGCEYGSSNSGGDVSTACYPGGYPSGFQRGEGSLSTIRGQQQIVNVTSISGSGPYNVGISPGIYADNFKTSHSPGAWWATSPIYNDAVENISLDHTNGGDGIDFFNCTGCWVKGVRGVRASVTGTGWANVTLSLCNHCTVRDSYFYGYDGDSYGIAVDLASDVLIENNITQRPEVVSFFNSDCEGCVADYNFGTNDVFTNSSNWLSQSSYYHSVDLFSLLEGNIGSGIYADSFHGTKGLNTQFRNRFDGREENNGNATYSGTVALRLNPGARYNNAIGNILGTPGYHTVYESTPASYGSLYNSVIDAGAYGETGTMDALVAPTSMFWGNWDVVSNASRWCGNASDPGWSTTCASVSEVPTGLSNYANAVPLTTTLPPSFIYSAKPSWWPANKAWPPIGPDVSGGNVGQCSGGIYDSSEAISSAECSGGSFSPVAGGMVNSIPAMDCYFNIMGGVPNGTGNALSFDPSLCYASGGGGDTQPPTVSITNPINGATVSSTVIISANASDNVAVASVQFFVDGAAIGTDGAPPYTFSWDSTSVSNGTHTITAKATDTSGNAASASITVTVMNIGNGGGGLGQVIQTCGNQAYANKNVACTFGNAIQAGNVIVVYGSGSIGSSTGSISGCGLTWTYLKQDAATGYVSAYAPVTNTSGCTLTMSESNSPSDESYVNAIEVSGITTTVDGNSYSYNTNPGQSSYATPDIITTSGNDFVIGSWLVLSNNQYGSPTVNSPFAPLSFSAGNNGLITYDNQSTPGSIFATINTNNYSNQGLQTVAFKTSGSGGGGDTQAPTVSITAPSSGSTVSSTISVQASASDNVGVTEVQFLLDGSVSATDLSSPYTWSWNTASSSNGPHTLSAKAYDAAGNVGTATNVGITVANTSGTETSTPSIASFSANPGTIAGGQASTLSWVVSGNPAPTIGITPGIGQVSGSSVSVSPSETTAYTLTAQNSLGIATAQTTVTVETSGGGGGGGSGGGGGGGGGGGSGSGSGSSSGSGSGSSSDSSPSALQALLQSLLAELESLINELNTQLVASFTRNLTIGSSGQDVKNLQIFLNDNGYTVSLSGAGSPGHEGTTFGAKTAQALMKFQAKHQLKATGFFGPATRAFMEGKW